MPKLLWPMLAAALIMPAERVSAQEPDLVEAARLAVRHWAVKFTRCPDPRLGESFWYGRFETPFRVLEVYEPRITFQTTEVSDVSRLNGIEFSARTEFLFKGVRNWTSGYGWSVWAQSGYRVAANITKQKGHWTVEDLDGPNTPKAISCADIPKDVSGSGPER